MKVLFVCEGNMMRSQMAEAFYNNLTKTQNATSAGALATQADAVFPEIFTVMNEVGVSMEGMKSDQLTPEMVDGADKIILFPTPYMPEYAAKSPKATLWKVDDPYYKASDSEAAVRHARDVILAHVKELIEKDSHED